MSHSTGGNESIVQLLQHFKSADENGRVTKLLSELDELSSRVQVRGLGAESWLTGVSWWMGVWMRGMRARAPRGRRACKRQMQSL
jgi:hypothetical protein